MRKVLEDDNPAPFSSDKIRAKILDLGEGASIKYVRTEGGSKNRTILRINSLTEVRTRGGGGPKMQKFCGRA